MLSYNNDTKFKKQFVAEVVKHRKADMILQGSYGEQNGRWRGCAVACSLRSLDIIRHNEVQSYYDDHGRFESEGLWPKWLARLEDIIFEGLPKDAAMRWPERLAKAVPVGVDLTPVKWKFCAFLMHENIERVLSLDIEDSLKKQVVDAIRRVLAVHENGDWDESAWSAAASAAESARSAAESAWSAAESAAWSAAASAAESAAASAAESAWSAAASAAESAAASAAESAWSAAESAAWSAAESAAWSAAESARSAAFTRYSKKLIELLEAE